MKEWGDERDRPSASIRLEFALLAALTIFMVLFALYALVVSSPAHAHQAGLTAGGEVHYPNRTAARAAGAAPIDRGQQAYGSHLGRDGDGDGDKKACEQSPEAEITLD